MEKAPQYIILYDGICGLCNRFVTFVIARDRGRRFFFASLQSETGRALLARFGRDTDVIDSVCFIDETVPALWERSTAVCKVLALLDGGWPLFSVFSLLPLSLTDYVYRFIASRRYQMFGKLHSCPIPDAKDRDRFI